MEAWSFKFCVHDFLLSYQPFFLQKLSIRDIKRYRFGIWFGQKIRDLYVIHPYSVNETIKLIASFSRSLFELHNFPFGPRRMLRGHFTNLDIVFKFVKPGKLALNLHPGLLHIAILWN